MRLTILHTNDIHGSQERLAQIATLVRGEKTGADHQVLYLDAGDVEDPANRLSNVTKGAAMHQLLARAACDAATVGNASWLRYGAAVLEEHARAAAFPQLLANFVPVRGPVPHVRFGPVGVFGLTASFRGSFEGIEYGFQRLDELEVARRAARELRASGVSLVVLLSHLGLHVPGERWDDRRIAAELQDDVDVIVGGHTHDVLRGGERVGRVLIVQAGAFGEHLGRVEIDGDEVTARVDEVGGDVEPHPAIEAEARRIEAEVTDMLAEPLGIVDEPIGAAWVAEMLRVRLGAEVGLFADGLLDGTLRPGLVTRGEVWEFSPTANNPGVTEMTGGQLRELIARADEPDFVAEKPPPLRGRPRGRVRLACPDLSQIDPARVYRVAGSDWLLDSYGGYAKQEWGLRVRYEFPVTIREAIEAHLRHRRPTTTAD